MARHRRDLALGLWTSRRDRWDVSGRQARSRDVGRGTAERTRPFHLASGASIDACLIFWLALGIAVLPLMVDGVRAIHEGWHPYRDSAFVERRVHDVFTHQTPLVGMPAGGLQAGQNAYHLGPLEFWLLAVPCRLADLRTAGTIVGLPARSGT